MGVSGIAVRAHLLIYSDHIPVKAGTMKGGAGSVERQPCVYILASRKHGTLYAGVTSNIVQRLYQHRSKEVPGFSTDHDISTLVWFEMHEAMESAILREKRIKKWNREWKIRLIEEGNPDWLDLATSLGFEPLPRQDKNTFRHSREGGNP
jgi:putative endonuclease